MVGQQRAVRIAIGRYDRIQPFRIGPLAGQHHILVPNGFGINGNELRRAAQRHRVSPQCRNDARQHITADRRMLVHPNSPPSQSLIAKEGQIARDIIRLGINHFGQRRGVPQGAARIKQVSIDIEPLTTHPGLVVFQHLAVRAIEFDAVAVVRNMAAGDHQRGDRPAKGIQRKRGRWDQAAIDRIAAHITHAGRASRQNARAAGAQIAGQRHSHTRRKFTQIGQMLQKSARIGVADVIGHRHDLAPRTTGAKLHARCSHYAIDRDLLRRHQDLSHFALLVSSASPNGYGADGRCLRLGSNPCRINPGSRTEECNAIANFA